MHVIPTRSQYLVMVITGVADPWYFGAGPNLYLWLMDPDPTPDPTPFFSNFKDAKKIIFFPHFFQPQAHYFQP